MKTLMPVVAVSVVLVAVGGCSGSTTITKASQPASPSPISVTPAGVGATDEPVATPENTPTPTPTAPALNAVGSVVSLTGQNDGEQADVTLVRIVDPASGGEYDTPTSGSRYIAFQFKVVDTGSTVLDECGDNDVTVLDSLGQSYDTAIVSDLTAGPTLGCFKTSIGSQSLGYVVAEVPTTVAVATVRFALDSGYSDQIGEWKVG